MRCARQAVTVTFAGLRAPLSSLHLSCKQVEPGGTRPGNVNACKNGHMTGDSWTYKACMLSDSPFDANRFKIAKGCARRTTCMHLTMRAWPVARSFDAPSMLCERSERADNKLDKHASNKLNSKPRA